MVWWVVWSVLAVGALVVAFLLWRRLARAARRTMAEADRASGVLAALADRIEAVEGETAPFQPQPGLSHDPVEVQARLTVLRKERARRASRRRRGHDETYQRWGAYLR